MAAAIPGLNVNRAEVVLDREFLEIRAKLLELAASLDRLERAAGSVSEDERIRQMKQSLSILASAGADRAERLQLVFSRPYEANWRETFEIDSHRSSSS